MRKLLRVLKPVIIVTVLSLLMVELGLMLFDPWVVDNLPDWGRIERFILPDPSGYTYPPNARLDLNTWSFTTTAEGTRTVPAADPDGRRVVFVGDSVTMSEGVNDEHTWVSLVADRLGLNAVNEGHMLYSAENVKLLVAQYPDDCLVFLTIDNDPQSSYFYDAEAVAQRVDPPWRPYIVRYIEGIRLQTQFRTQSYESGEETSSVFDDSMSAIIEHPRLLLVAFDTVYGGMVRDAYGAVLIPHYQQRISVFDVHANPAGNVEIADGITPVVRQWLDSGACDDAES